MFARYMKNHYETIARLYFKVLVNAMIAWLDYRSVESLFDALIDSSRFWEDLGKRFFDFFVFL